MNITIIKAKPSKVTKPEERTHLVNDFDHLVVEQLAAADGHAAVQSALRSQRCIVHSWHISQARG